MTLMRFNKPSKYSNNQRVFIFDGMLGFSANALTSGVFLTGLLLSLGATNLMVGLISSAGAWALMLSLLSSLVVESVRQRKRLLLTVMLIFRLFTTLPDFLPLILGNGQHNATLAAIMITIGFTVNTICTTDLPVFMLDSLPMEGRNSFMYVRMKYTRIANTVVSIGAGILMDALDKSYLGFLIIYSSALAFGVIQTINMSRVQGDSVIRTDKLSVAAFRKRFFEPFRNKRYLRFLIFTLFFFFFYFIAASYISLYQYKYLKLDFLTISIYNTSVLFTMIILTTPWRKIESRIGQTRVLALTSIAITADFVVYGFLTTQTLWLLPLSGLFAALGGSGLWTCILPYRYNLMPRDGKTIYEAWNGTLFAIASFLGALAGGKLQVWLPSVTTSFLVFSSFQIMFLFAGISAIVSALVFAWQEGCFASDQETEIKRRLSDHEKNQN